jgi:hypothetical protein
VALFTSSRHRLISSQRLTGSPSFGILVAIMRDHEEMALGAIEIAKANFIEAQIRFDLDLAKAAKRLEDYETQVLRAEQYLKQVQAWDQRRDEILAAVRNGATAATIAKTYGLSRSRAAQLLYRAERDLGHNRYLKPAPASEADPPARKTDRA